MFKWLSNGILSTLVARLVAAALLAIVGVLADQKLLDGELAAKLLHVLSGSN